MDAQPLGLAHFWAQAGLVNRGVAWILLLMSIASWSIILGKLRLALALRGGSTARLTLFWAASSLRDGALQLRAADRSGLLAAMAEAAADCAANYSAPDRSASGSTSDTPSIGSSGAHSDRLMRELRSALRGASVQLDAGQTWLASVGATAPFVGLFGTVWGIYHALVGIANAGQVTIDRVAGPVGEALIMTALGLVVAIPAVLAYNAYARLARSTVADLDGFARDLHAFCLDPAHP